MRRDIPDVTHRIAVDDDPRLSRFSELADNAPLAAPVEVGEEDTAMILYTSGTTGRPKGAMLAHCNIIHSAMVFVSCLKLTAADRSIAAVPLGHVTGVVANIMTMVRCAGALIIMAEFKAAEYLKMAARERVTYTVMVPAMYNLCLLQPDFDSYDLSSWRIGGFGGAPMPIATIEKLDAKIPGLKLMNCYGATETTSPSTMMPGELTASHIMGLLVMILGLILFFGVHTLTIQRKLRAQVIAATGEGGYKIGYALASFAGLALIVWGFALYRATGWIDVWNPPTVAQAHHGGPDAARGHHGGRVLHPGPDLYDAEASDADGHQAVGCGASARQRRSRLDHPVRLVSRMGGI